MSGHGQRRARLGTRGSDLALAQSKLVAAQLERIGWKVELVVIKTTGDRITDSPLDGIGTKGLFVSEIEQALLEDRIDLAVHSMKDLPGRMPDGLMLAAVPAREDPRDVLAGRMGATVASLPRGAVVGTSSPRRRAGILAIRPDLEVSDLRGNIGTRLRKLDEGRYDAICIAAAGLHRLGLSERITEYIDLDVMLPAVGQGALAVQTRTDALELTEALRAIHDERTGLAVRAERAVLAALGGGCGIPLGVLGAVEGCSLVLRGALCAGDGGEVIRESVEGSGTSDELGRELARRLWVRGGHLFPDVKPNLVP